MKMCQQGRAKGIVFMGQPYLHMAPENASVSKFCSCSVMNLSNTFAFSVKEISIIDSSHGRGDRTCANGVIGFIDRRDVMDDSIWTAE
jgi:hypothetical protein